MWRDAVREQRQKEGRRKILLSWRICTWEQFVPNFGSLITPSKCVHTKMDSNRERNGRILEVWRKLDMRMKSSGKTAGVFEEIPGPPTLCMLVCGGPLISSTSGSCMCAWDPAPPFSDSFFFCFNTPQAPFYDSGITHFPFSPFSSSSLLREHFMWVRGGEGGKKKHFRSYHPLERCISLWIKANSTSVWLHFN